MQTNALFIEALNIETEIPRQVGGLQSASLDITFNVYALDKFREHMRSPEMSGRSRCSGSLRKEVNC